MTRRKGDIETKRYLSNPCYKYKLLVIARFNRAIQSKKLLDLDYPVPLIESEAITKLRSKVSEHEKERFRISKSELRKTKAQISF
ncbi:MAG: hypothetical protein WBE28_04695 [bacterium]